MRNVRTVALVLLAGLLAAACGARLPSSERRQAAAAVLNAGSGGGSGLPGSNSGPGVTNTGPSAGPGVTGPGTSTGPGTTSNGGGTQPGTQNNGGGQGNNTQASGSCPTSGSDVGLTSNSVSWGTIASTTGPVSGLFEGAFQGARAVASFFNSQGGICGHGIKLDAADDGTNCGRNQNDTEDLSKKDFALVGSFSLYDGCGADYIKAHNVPDFHVQLDPAAGQPASHFDAEPGPLGYATGMFAYYAKKLGDKVKHVGTLYPNIPSAAAKQKGFVKAAQSEGWQFVYSRAGDATETDWTQDFVKMCKQKGVQVFFTSAENAANAAKMLQNEDSAGCDSSLVNIIPIAYDQAFIQDAGGSKRLNGLMGWNEYSLFFNKGEAQQIPELQNLQAWFARVNPGKPLNLYALFAWAEGRLFQQAFQSAGKTINRQTLAAAAAKIHNFSASGIIAPVDPASKSEGPHCYVLWRYQSGAFARMDTPPGQYRCDGRFLPLNG
jgi:ABC-type branched-subunit amino acid transport system substrate-binding protein